MDDLELINRKGIATIQEIREINETNERAMFFRLDTLSKWGSMRTVDCIFPKGRRRLYIKNEVYEYFFEDDE